MATDQTDPDPISTVVFAPFRLVWRTLQGLVFLWFVSCIVHISYVRLNDLEPASHMEKLIGYYMDTAGGQSKWVSQIGDAGYRLVFEATDAQRRFFSGAPTSSSTMNLGANTRKSVWAVFKPDIVVIGYATLVFGIKLGLSLLAAILISVMWLAATADGLVQRYIRRACAGHESASIYHRAKYFGVGLMPSAIGVIFFCWPVAVDPGWIFVPGALAIVLLARLQATYYKKYL